VEKTWPQSAILPAPGKWNPDDFAREQIRGLVRRVFVAGGSPPAKQVVFSAMESQTSIVKICDQVGQALALETRADIVVVSREFEVAETAPPHPHYAGRIAIKSWALQLASNLWRVSASRLQQSVHGSGTGLWLACLAELRNEFEYAIIEGPAAGASSEAALLGRLTDGIILVLGAHNTRKATACKIKDTLESAHSRILGSILNERRFPVPEAIYRRL
jgi:hypothetical protein